MEIKSHNTYDNKTGVMTKCTVYEPDGTKREICPLFAGQMVRSYNGRSYYAREMPIDYFEKAMRLEANGWYRWYHYNNWIRQGANNNDYSGISTDDAIRALDNPDKMAIVLDKE